eukprot:1362318-Amorphochlora_amoeboformis.AAC.2
MHGHMEPPHLIFHDENDPEVAEVEALITGGGVTDHLVELVGRTATNGVPLRASALIQRLKLQRKSGEKSLEKVRNSIQGSKRVKDDWDRNLIGFLQPKANR